MATITISCAGDTTRQVRGTVVREHFLVHRDEDYRYHGWTTTHIETGMAIIKGVKREAAIYYARRMANAAKRGGLDLTITDPKVLSGSVGWSEFAAEGRAIRTEEPFPKFGERP